MAEDHLYQDMRDIMRKLDEFIEKTQLHRVDQVERFSEILTKLVSLQSRMLLLEESRTRWRNWMMGIGASLVVILLVAITSEGIKGWVWRQLQPPPTIRYNQPGSP